MEMERGSVDELAREAMMRGMSYGQYVAARYYPSVIVEPLPDGGVIRREAAMPPVLPGWEEDVTRRRSRAVDGKCRTNKPKKEKEPLKCVVCGHPLRGGYRKYCSEECRLEAKRARHAPKAVYLPEMREDKPCVICGKIMLQATRPQKYCSPGCRQIGTARAQQRWRAEHPLEPRAPRVCQVCGGLIDGKGWKYCDSCSREERKARARLRQYRK